MSTDDVIGDVDRLVEDENIQIEYILEVHTVNYHANVETLLLRSNMGCRLVHLYLNLAHSTGQGQGHADLTANKLKMVIDRIDITNLPSL